MISAETAAGGHKTQARSAGSAIPGRESPKIGVEAANPGPGSLKSPWRLRIRPQKRLKIKSVPPTELKSLRERYFFHGYLVPGKVPRSFCLTDCGCFKRRVSPATIVMKSEIKEASGRWSSLEHVPLSGLICCFGRYNFKKQSSGSGEKESRQIKSIAKSLEIAAKLPRLPNGLSPEP